MKNPVALEKLVERDKNHIWHPLTQHKTAHLPLGIVKAEGALVWDEDGKSYIDGIASWYTAMYGHCNPYIVKAMTQQMQKLDFVMFSGFTHAPAVELSEKLIKILPGNQAKIFFNDNGSTAIEAAIKMAIQYHHNKGEKRDTIIAFEDGFHGDTFGAMSASGISSYNGPFEDFLLKVIRVPVPTEENLKAVLGELDKILAENQCSAFVFEPLVQGAAGMKFHSTEGLDQMIAVCQKAGALCIADEIMTGFGKTGKNFASEDLTHAPDIICLSKALTAGMFPLSITSCSQTVFDAFLSDEVSKGFFHAHTYSAHPVGCAAALASIELLNSDEILERRAYIAHQHQRFTERIQSHPKVKNARSMGVIFALDLAVETNRYGSLRDKLYRSFMTQGVNLRPLGNTIYTLPPYVITDEQLQRIYSTIEGVLEVV
ncbi:adenosylmethionine--8-amino-7-oxononanoate transaminase [Flagellimonas meridianipacifica]|uniref:Adenosylmethionine-8-amino-7-oxononanoate aminotransferase n=1 Tax=Flagellimonas meridianipacifica TaxID=1080225 RepID=A0A2T0MGC1_9FLAO|nr:adenosylmethionine--8-amino-7-oxononanoate transaminase [Allomuricauda pacifica]PRX56623.1 adenosylmethionine-8-amino-7-oxononanoate aminotransferase [Allomuricauda pacifica]